jgi:hypothetical protein
MTVGIHPEELARSNKLKPFGEGYPIDDPLIELISSFTGTNSGILNSVIAIMPYYSLFNSIYMRAVVANSHKYIKQQTTEEGGIISTSVWIGDKLTGKQWAISDEDFNKEYQKFRKEYRKFRFEKDGVELSTPELHRALKEIHLGYDTAERFRRYFSGEETPRRPISGSCAWPLGCVQNLPTEEFPKSSNLLTHAEHSKPKILFQADADQTMCASHNMLKTNNTLFDVGGILWCILGPEDMEEAD